MASGSSFRAAELLSQRPTLIRRVRVVGFVGAGLSFLLSQLGLLWAFVSGGVSWSPTPPTALWMSTALLTVFFVLLLADSYRPSPRWSAEADDGDPRYDEFEPPGPARAKSS
jgi:hypothetical protein